MAVFFYNKNDPNLQQIVQENAQRIHQAHYKLGQ
jgi:hypothetical protein